MADTQQKTDAPAAQRRRAWFNIVGGFGLAGVGAIALDIATNILGRGAHPIHVNWKLFVIPIAIGVIGIVRGGVLLRQSKQSQRLGSAEPGGKDSANS